MLMKMKVQEYLETHTLEQLQEEFKIEIRDYPAENLVVLNYSMIESDKNNPIVKECRALILEKGTWKVIARSFDRFLNINEDQNTKDFPISKSLIQEKVDGCCDAETKLITKDGKKTIKEICDKKLKIEIMGFDEISGEKIWTKIQGHSIKQNNNDWYEITVKNGKTLKLTGNHRVYLPKYNCYRKISEIKEGDTVLLLND